MSEINYSWAIDKLECALSEDGFTNVVKIIHWTYRAQCDDKSVEMSNQYPLTPPLPENYIDYSLLTPEIVIGWLEGNLDVGYLRSYLSDQLKALYEGPIVPLPLPWIKEEVVSEEIIDPNPPEVVLE
jgi:hypothetical protein